MLRRLMNLVGIETNELVRKMYRPIPTLRFACKQLKKRAVQAYVAHERLEEKLKTLPEGELKDRIKEISAKLAVKAKEYKNKHGEYSGKISEFEGRVELVKLTKGLLDGVDDSPVDLIKQVEDEVKRLEIECQALLNWENG